MKKIVFTFVVFIVLSAQVMNAGCRVRMTCGSVNDFVECDGEECKRIFGADDRLNKVECDGVETKCSDAATIGGV